MQVFWLGATPKSGEIWEFRKLHSFALVLLFRTWANLTPRPNVPSSFLFFRPPPSLKAPHLARAAASWCVFSPKAIQPIANTTPPWAEPSQHSVCGHKEGDFSQSHITTLNQNTCSDTAKDNQLQTFWQVSSVQDLSYLKPRLRRCYSSPAQNLKEHFLYTQLPRIYCFAHDILWFSSMDYLCLSHASAGKLLYLCFLFVSICTEKQKFLFCCIPNIIFRPSNASSFKKED